MAALFRVAEDRIVGDHRYLRVVAVNPQTLAQDLAPRVRARYVDQEAARERLRRAAEELTEFSFAALPLTPEEIEEAVAAETAAVLPTSWLGNRPEHLSTQRSEFGEIVAAEVLMELFGTRIPASRISEKEVPDQQTRGADVMGLEGDGDAVVLVLCEVKGSEQAASPPSVVADMEGKLRFLTENRRAMTQELTWLRDHADDAHSEVCARICAEFLLRRQTFTLLLAPILVRRSDVAKPTDCGRFETHADTFGAPIRWVTVLIDAALLDIATEVYRLAGSDAA